MSEDEIAKQPGRNRKTAFNRGRQAFEDGLPIKANPFTPGQVGHLLFEQGYTQAKGEGMAKQKEGEDRPVLKKKNQPEESGGSKPKAQAPIQGELIEDARQKVKLPARVRNLLPELCDAEEQAGSARLEANRIIAQIQTYMAEQGVPMIELPNGGHVKYTETKKAKYVGPKKKSTADDEENEESEE